MYKVLSDITAYVFSDADPTKSWARRRESQRGTAKLCNVMEQEINLLSPLTNAACPVSPGGGNKGELLLDQFGVRLAQKLLGAGRGAREVAEILVGTAAAFVANTATAVS